MSSVRFISDLHLGHANILKYLVETSQNKYTFEDIYEHIDFIIEQWNSIVNKKDVVYILGDISMETYEYYYVLDALNGRKKVILGNHDNDKQVPQLLKHVESVAGIHLYSDKRFGKFWLTHCPVHPKELDTVRKVYGNIHGHIHSGYKIEDKRYMCVCAEHINYKPKTLQELFYE